MDGRAIAARVRAGAGETLGAVRPAGWLVLAIAVLAGVGTGLAQWRELAVLATTALLVVLLCVPFLVGRTAVRIELDLEPDRVTAGESVAAGVTVRNTAGSRLWPTTLEVPVGTTVHRYGVAGLPPGASHEESFTIRTERRGVIPVGPASTRRGDPLGLFSRDQQWTGLREILVRPPILPLESLGAGLLRDLEGISTDAVSQSDLAFHALREYVPGDDLRHIHWRSSAKAMASAGESSLLVRQYLDTRRSHATIVVDDLLKAWADPDDFETAMSIAASLAVRAVLDEFDVSFVCGPTASSGSAAGGEGRLALDAVCRAQTGLVGLPASGRTAVQIAPDTSLAFLVGGPGTGFLGLLRASAAFAPEVRRFGILLEPGTASRVTDTGGLSVMHLGDAADLAGLLRWSVAA